MKPIPAPLYRWLPSLYVLAGGLVEIWHPQGLGKASAFLLVLVGVAVFNMRLNTVEGKSMVKAKTPRDLARSMHSYAPAIRDVLTWADEAIAWGTPDQESLGYTFSEWIDLVRALRDEVVRLRRRTP